ncbi:hypothetical protein BSY16_6253 (plasmid) [Sinorhizobium sp. RAC02]|nr:hypothetical protein BSY16_6253 [Sinorhizobium sp. RAC02]
MLSSAKLAVQYYTYMLSDVYKSEFLLSQIKYSWVLNTNILFLARECGFDTFAGCWGWSIAISSCKARLTEQVLHDFNSKGGL